MSEFTGKTRADAVIPAKLAVEKCTSFASIRAEGYEVFSVGALYVHVNIDRSLVEEFSKSDYPGKPAVTEDSILTFETAVVQPCGWWSNHLEVMDKASYSYFRAWMNRWVFTKKAERMVYVVERHCVPILDPIMAASGVKPRPEALDLYLVNTPAWSLVPRQAVGRVGGISYDEAKPVIQLEKAPPSESAKTLIAGLSEYYKEGS